MFRKLIYKQSKIRISGITKSDKRASLFIVRNNFYFAAEEKITLISNISEFVGLYA